MCRYTHCDMFFIVWLYSNTGFEITLRLKCWLSTLKGISGCSHLYLENSVDLFTLWGICLLRATISIYDSSAVDLNLTELKLIVSTLYFIFFSFYIKCAGAQGQNNTVLNLQTTLSIISNWSWLTRGIEQEYMAQQSIGTLGKKETFKGQHS